MISAEATCANKQSLHSVNLMMIIVRSTGIVYIIVKQYLLIKDMLKSLPEEENGHLNKMSPEV